MCTFEGQDCATITDGTKGLVRRIMKMTPEAKYNFAAMKIRDLQLPSEFMNIAQCGSYITECPYEAEKFINQMDINAMKAKLDSWEKLNADFKAKVVAQTVFEK